MYKYNYNDIWGYLMAIYKRGYFDLYMYQGDTGNIKINGIPITANYKIYLQVFKMDGSETPVNMCKESNFIPFVIFPISSDISNELEPGQYYYAVKLCLEDTYGITEETVIPPLRNVTVTPSNYKNKAFFWVYPKQIEGTINDSI